MEKITVVAKLNAELRISEELSDYFRHMEGNSNAWIAKDDGDAFLHEFGGHWNEIFIDAANSFYRRHFSDLGLDHSNLPEVQLTDYRSGSWLMEAALTMFGTVGTVYTLLKGVSELPTIADGLEETNKRFRKELSGLFQKKVIERIEPTISKLPQLDNFNLPDKLVDVSFSIDARPLRGLTPDKITSHSIHLNVGVSRSSISIENLGKGKLDNLRIGLFKSKTQRNNWDLSEAFIKHVPQLSGKQSISMATEEFLKQATQSKLDLVSNESVYVDCWIQDNSGIYLFNFLLE